MTRQFRSRSGFTLVELLTVIAIIAILAAIIFPVFSVVRGRVRQAQCISNLHSISQAIKMYKDDFRAYPDALYGYGFDTSGGGGQQFLYPTYIKDLSGFHCPLNSEPTTSTRRVPGLNGVTGQPMSTLIQTAQGVQAVGLNYFVWDSYDGSLVPHTQPGTAPYVVHYLKKWTPTPTGALDNPRQLQYRTPPDNTVVAWCTYHRGYQGQQAEPGSMDMVLFLDGRVKPVPAAQTEQDLKAHAVIPGT